MSNYTQDRNETVERFNENYQNIVGIINERSQEIKQKNREIIKNNTRPIYKHYIKQGAKYAICGLAVALGALLVFSPATIPFLAPVLAKLALPKWAIIAIGSAGITAGVCGGIATRLDRKLEYNFNNDRKRARYFWRESRRLRRIEKNLAKSQEYMATNSQKANFFRKKALDELKIYEQNSLELFRQTSSEIKTKTLKTKAKQKSGWTWAGVDHFDRIEDIRFSQLYQLKEAALLQLKNADIMRKEAGLPQNERIIDLFAKICEDAKEKDVDISSEIISNIKNHKELHNCKTSLAYKQSIKKMLDDTTTSDKDFAKLFASYTDTYGLTAEDVFNECIANNFGKRKVSNTIAVVLDNSNLKDLTMDTIDEVKSQYDKMEEDEKENILNIISQRQSREKDRTQASKLGEIQGALAM